MTIEDAIQERLTCPWCGSSSRVPSTAFTSKPNRYLLAVAQEVGVSTEELIGRMKVVECADCETSYCDPWLSSVATQWLFNLGYPQHNTAWKTFYHWLERTPEFETRFLPRKEGIWRFIQSKIGLVNSYGEIGCPFMGLLTYFQCCKHDPLTSLARFERHYLDQLHTGKHPAFIPRLKLAQRAFFRFRYWRNRLRGMRRPPAPKKTHVSVPAELCFVRSPSSLLWGGNCVSLSTSCAAMALANLQTRVVDFSDLDFRFDVLAFFNTLDHQDKPLRVLQKALDAARFVVIELHRDEKAGKQHLYVINDALARTASRNGWNLEEFSNTIDGGNGDRLYLLSKNHES
jgi:hypothetical protein